MPTHWKLFLLKNMKQSSEEELQTQGQEIFMISMSSFIFTRTTFDDVVQNALEVGNYLKNIPESD